MKIRKAVIGDLGKIQELNKKLFDEEFEKYDETIDCGWPLSGEGEKFYRDRIDGDEGCAFVLVEGEEIVGYLVASLSKDEFYRDIGRLAELDDMYVLAEHRNGGYGSLLYGKFIEWCKDNKIVRLKVLVNARNKRAIGFYRKNGFEDYSLVLERGI